MRQMILIILCSLGVFACSSADVNKTDTSNLIGTWTWISSCGGFTGGCWYPSVNNYELIEFRSNLTYLQNINDSIVFESRYSISDTITSGSDVLYTIEFETGIKTTLRFSKDTLSIQGGDFWKNYKKLKKK